MIGTSKGLTYENELNLHAGLDNNVLEPDEEDTGDDMVRDPEKVMRDMQQSKDPKVIYNDAGEAVDYQLDGMLRIKPIQPKLEPRSDAGATAVPVDWKIGNSGYTITDADLDKGLDVGLAFSGGGLSTIRRGPQMRKGANDNAKLEIEMPKHVEDAIDLSWIELGKKHRRGIEIQHEKSRMLQIQLERDFSELERARYNKLNAEYEKLFPSPE